jgi:hypothetical protein
VLDSASRSSRLSLPALQGVFEYVEGNFQAVPASSRTVQMHEEKFEGMPIYIKPASGIRQQHQIYKQAVEAKK